MDVLHQSPIRAVLIGSHFCRLETCSLPLHNPVIVDSSIFGYGFGYFVIHRHNFSLWFEYIVSLLAFYHVDGVY